MCDDLGNKEAALPNGEQEGEGGGVLIDTLVFPQIRSGMRSRGQGIPAT